LKCARPICGTEWCFNCGKKWHEGFSCEGFTKYSADAPQDAESFQTYVDGNRVKNCPKCKFLIEKGDLCNRVVCAYCFHRFCWLCNEDLVGGNHYSWFNVAGCPGLLNGGKKHGYGYRALVLSGLVLSVPLIVSLAIPATIATGMYVGGKSASHKWRKSMKGNAITLIVSPPKAGKSTLMNRFLTDSYSEENENSEKPENDDNLVESLSFKRIQIGKKSVAFTPKEFDSQNIGEDHESIIKRVRCYVLMYDITDRKSFEGAQRLYNEIEEILADKGWKGISGILVGNKTDLEEERQVKYQEGRYFAEKFNWEFAEISLKNAPVEEVDQIFLRAREKSSKYFWET